MSIPEPRTSRVARPLGAWGMACITLTLLAPTSLGGIQTPGDSTQLRRQAQRAQADFEVVHRASLSRARQDWSGSCDEQLGRICLRFSGGGRWDPAEEDPRVTAARDDLLETLRRIGEALPGDLWIMGQRVRYLGDVGRWSQAEDLARGCTGGAAWWCSALLGYVLHRSGSTPEALDAFARALGSMDHDEARTWSDPQRIVEYPVHRWLRNPAGLTGDDALRRFWTLADPLYLTPGNERLAEHYSRIFASSLYGRTALTMGLSWGRPFEELLLRYGFIAGWERTLPRMGESPSGSVVEHYHPESRGLLPPLEALERPSRLAEGAWEPQDDRPRSSSAPVLAPLIVAGAGQIAVLRRGANLLVLAGYEAPRDTLLERRRPRTGTLGWVHGPGGDSRLARLGTGDPGAAGIDTLAGLFLVPEDGDPVPLAALEEGGEGVLQLRAPPGRYLLSMELWSPQERWGARFRHGVEAEPVPGDVPTLSDLLLLRGGEELPGSLGEALPRMRPGTRLEPGTPLTVAWEVYGLGDRREPLTFRLSLVEENASFLRRALSRTGLLQKPPVLTLSWEEGSSNHADPLFRAVDLDLGPVGPGTYILRLEMDIPYRTMAISQRRMTVPELVPPSDSRQ